MQSFNNKHSRDFLMKMMPKDSVGVEIGTWMGAFPQRFLEVNKPKKMYLIDPYKHFEQFDRSCYGGNDMDQKKMDDIYEFVANLFKKQIENGRIEILRNTSDNVVSQFEKDSLDWVYIDGNHSYDFVKQDLANYFPKIKSGGFITGDDYGVKGWWNNGVKKAVDEFVNQKKGKVRLVQIKNKQYIIKKL